MKFVEGPASRAVSCAERSVKLMFGFGKNPVEKRISKEVAVVFRAMGMPQRQAVDIADGIVRKAKEALVSAGQRESMYIEGMGDGLLSNKQRDSKSAAFVQKLLHAWVSENDIRSWHNLSPLERKVMLESDTLMIVAFVRTHAEERGSVEVAAKEAAVLYPSYVWDFTQYVPQGVNPSLPAELKLRVNRYRDQRQRSDQHRFLAELRADGFFNEHIRRRLQRGELNY